jgi:Tol biopolymer transport system component/predicted Ser/Thr protein kinase
MPQQRDVLGGRYTLLERIGSGGYGTVFRARDKTKNRIVAVKILRSELADDPDYVRRFRREASIAGLLDSRHIVRVFEAGHARLGSQDVHFQVMEYVEGPTLQQLVKERTQLAVPEALEIAVGVARALEEAHDKGVVHRDIKPKNIFIAEDETVKVGDFGIAGAVDFPSLRPDDPILGTPRYMSPEQCLGKKDEIDIRSDIYSLGVVLYEMIAGRPPFEGDSPSSVAYMHIHETPAPLRQLIPSAPREVEALVECCLDKKPEGRFQSPLALRRAIEETLHIEEEAPEETPVKPLSEAPPKRRPVLAGIAAVRQSAWRVVSAVARTAIVAPAARLAVLVRRAPLSAVAVVHLPVGAARAAARRVGRGSAAVARAVWAGPSRGVGVLRRMTLPRPSVPRGWWTGRRFAATVVVLGLGGAGVVGGVLWTRGGGGEGSAVVGLGSATASATASVTVNPVVASTPLPPEASRIAYVSPNLPADLPANAGAALGALTSDIYVVQPDGQSPQLVAAGISKPWGPSALAWSPTGDGIALCGDDGLRVTTIGGTSPQTLNAAPCQQPAWSPDGEGIAFTGFYVTEVDYGGGLAIDTGRSDIWVVKRDGTGLKNLTQTPDDSDVGASWSPDSTQLAFVKSSRSGEAREVYVIRADGTGLTRIGEGDSGPAWSPDGREIAFAKGGAISAANVESHETRRIADEGSAPRWSPDGSKIAYQRMVVVPGEEPWQSDLYLAARDGSGESKLTEAPGRIEEFSWSPDGQQLAFDFAPELTLLSEIYVVSADGSNMRPLTGRVNELWPAWSPRLAASYGLAATPTASPTPTATPSPDLAALVAQEKARQEALGWTVDCPDSVPMTREIIGTFDDLNDHWIAIFCESGSTGRPFTDKLVIYERQGSDLVALFELLGSPIGQLSMESLVDVQGDGSNDLRVSDWKGCNDIGCEKLRLYGLQGHQVLEIPLDLPVTGLLGLDHFGDGTSAVPETLEDLNADGGQEIIAVDVQWVLRGFAHYLSPYPIYVLNWDGQRYINASREDRFRGYFDAEIAKHESELTSETADEYRMSRAIWILLLYGHSGRASKGWTRFHEIVTELKTQCWKDALPTFEADLELSVPKDGSEPSTSAAGSSLSPPCSGTPPTTPTPSPTSTPRPPASGRIAFTSSRDGTEIFVIDADGTGLTKVTTTGLSFAPSWSPDGMKIVFYALGRGIGVVNADGTNPILLTNNLADDDDPSWSPDGSRIAFASHRDGDYEVYVVSSDGTGLERLTQNPASDKLPSWSPDGSRIAFVSDRDGQSEIYVMNRDGSDQRRLTSGGGWSPAWSPDGSKIAFSSNNEIYVMAADGSEPTRLTNNPALDRDPAWSPDGTWIAFVSDRDGNDEVYIMVADGTNQTNLSNNPGLDWHPAWSS